MFFFFEIQYSRGTIVWSVEERPHLGSPKSQNELNNGLISFNAHIHSRIQTNFHKSKGSFTPIYTHIPYKNKQSKLAFLIWLIINRLQIFFAQRLAKRMCMMYDAMSGKRDVCVRHWHSHNQTGIVLKRVCIRMNNIYIV